VIDYFVTWTRDDGGCYHVVEIPIKERYYPNFYLQGRIVAGELDRSVPEIQMKDPVWVLEDALDTSDRSEDPRWCRVDVLDPQRGPGGEKLRIRIEPDRPEYRPGDRVNVTVKVSDLQGNPRPAEVSLGAVDEAIYTFGEDRVADLARQFTDPRPPQRYVRKTWRSSQGDRQRTQEQVKDLKAMAQAMQKAVAQAAGKGDGKGASEKSLEALAGGETGSTSHRALLASRGGEKPASSFPLVHLRQDFRETASWQPQLRTNDQGVIATSFQLPDTLTRYRLTAVGLTRATEIGTGQAQIRVSQPLAVQILLPRFAVEKDRFQVIGLVHNNTARDRTYDVVWEVQGARVEDPLPGIAAWDARSMGEQTIARGQVAVPAGATVRVGFWLAADRIGTAQVLLRSSDSDHADAETRSLTVQPLGRPREVTFNGTFSKQGQVQLPRGFLVRDLRVSLARGEAVQALEGLPYLIEYPYGCVEQTMSRFLPAVAAKHALQQTPIDLPPDVAARLPGVLEQGLARLYRFQHEDGGWGWWEKDRTDLRMTVYVVHGLACCRSTGTIVDREVLTRGCHYLKTAPWAQQPDGTLAAQAWLALALAGQADTADLTGCARVVLDQSRPAEERCYFALACRTAGLQELSWRLWASLRDWQPATSLQRALFLNAQLTFAAPAEECRKTAALLLAAREGPRWESTYVTSWAIQALCQMIGQTQAATPARKVRILVAGKPVLDLSTPAELGKLVHRVHLSEERLPAEEGITIVMELDGAERTPYTISAVGVQRLDDAEPTGTELRLTRHLETVDGKPFAGPFSVGQVIAVRLRVELEKPQTYLLIEDRRPAGAEFADDRLFGEAAASASHVEFRDDRICVFMGGLSAGVHELVYYLRAETPGRYHLLPGCAYPMYAEQIRGETGSLQLEIRSP
jgi:uncharacterized protein YfaS (alpha-2-macroglobulin family)